jgi:hypothetical protein
MSIDEKPPAPKTAAEICAKFEPTEPAAKLLTPNMQPKAFLDLLIQKDLFMDAVHFVARTLSIREAAWWATVCSKPVAGAPAPVADAHKKADGWVHEPGDDLRRAAHDAAQLAGVGTPVGLACEAIFFAEGSIGPKDMQAIPPPPGLAHKMAANSIILASVADPKTIPAKFKHHLTIGQDVAAGKNRWKEKAEKKK